MNINENKYSNNNQNPEPNQEDESPLYTIEEEDDSESSEDEESENDSSYYEEDDLEDETEEEQDEADKFKTPSPFAIMVKTLLTPVEGWKKLKRSRLTTDKFAAGCFIPCMVIASLSEFIKIFYEANYTFGNWLLDTISTFLIFFFGYFSVIVIGSVILPKKSRVLMKKEIGKQFVMLNLSTLALFWAVIVLIPMLDPVLVFLPLWTIYLIYKGVRVIRVPKEVENSTTGYLCLLIVGMPLLWNWLINEVLFPLAGA